MALQLPEIVQKLALDVSGMMTGFQQVVQSGQSFITVMNALQQALQQMGVASNAAASGVNTVGAAAKNAAGAVQGAAGQIKGSLEGVAAASQAASATFSRNWINAVKDVNNAVKTLAAPGIQAVPGRPIGVPLPAPGIQVVPGRPIGVPLPAPGIQVVPGGPVGVPLAPPAIFTPPTAPGLPPTLAPPAAINDPARLERERREKEAQQEAARAAAKAAAEHTHALHRIQAAWMFFGRDIMALADRIANSVATTVSHMVPFFGPILGGAIRGAGMGGGLGGSFGGALGGTIGMGMGGPGGALAGAGIGQVVGYGLGAVAGAGIGGQLSALVQGITLAVNALETAFNSAAGAAKNVVSQVVVLASEFQRIEVAFEVFTGSAEKGRTLFGQMQELAVKTPYNLRQMVDVSQTLLAMGVPSEDIAKRMSQLGDVAAGDTDRLRRLALAFSEVIAEGKLTGQRMRQFAAAGFGVADIAGTMGISIAQVREQMREGGIPASVVEQTLDRITSAGQRFFQMSARQAGTVAGAWSNLIDKLEILGSKMGGAVFQKFDVAGMIGRFGNMLGENAPALLERMLGLLEAVKAALVGLVQAATPYWSSFVNTIEHFVGRLDATPASLENIRRFFVRLGDTILQTLGQVTRLIAALASMALPYFSKSLGTLAIMPGMDKDAIRAAQENLTELARQLQNIISVAESATTGGLKQASRANKQMLEESAPGGFMPITVPIGDTADILSDMFGRKKFSMFFANETAKEVLDLEMRKQGGVGARPGIYKEFFDRRPGEIQGFWKSVMGGEPFPMRAERQPFILEAEDVKRTNEMFSLFWEGLRGPKLAEETKKMVGVGVDRIPGVGGLFGAAPDILRGIQNFGNIKDKLIITVSPEAEKLVEKLQKEFKEGLDPLEKFFIQRAQIREAMVGPPTKEGVGPGALMESVLFQREIADKFRKSEVPSPTALGIGTKEAANSIADAVNRGGKPGFEEMLKEAGRQHQERLSELKKIKEFGKQGVLDNIEKKLDLPAPGNL